LDLLPNGLLLLDSHGRLLLANEAARRELNTGQKLRIDADQSLRATGQLDAAKFDCALNCARRRSRALLCLDEGAETMFLAIEWIANMFENEHVFILVLNRRDICSDIALQLLGKLYGLTFSEREVLAGLLAGQCVRDLANKRQRKIPTLRAQIVRLRSKFKVGRVDEILRLAAIIPYTQDATRTGLKSDFGGSISAVSPNGSRFDLGVRDDGLS
jgi:hypothetical protein